MTTLRKLYCGLICGSQKTVFDDDIASGGRMSLYSVNADYDMRTNRQHSNVLMRMFV